MSLKEFYNSSAWKHCRESYRKKCGGLCERCLKQGKVTPAEIVHHRVYLTEQNYTDPKMSLSFDNLECLCWEHHEQEHKGRTKRYKVDALGRVEAID